MRCVSLVESLPFEVVFMRHLFLCLSICVVMMPGSFQGPSSAGATFWNAPSFREVSKQGQLPTNEQMEQLAQSDPIAFLENCLRRYEKQIKGYRATLQKQERIRGQLGSVEVIGVSFQEEPFSVLLEWKKNPGLADRTLFIKGKYNDKILIMPRGLLRYVGIQARDPWGPDARASSRYPMTQFGLKIGMQRTLQSWEDARQARALHVTYLGKKCVPQAGNRECWILQRSRYHRPEADGVVGLTTCIDTETWLQVGSTIMGKDQLIAEYFFRDIELNPDFPPNTFTRTQLSCTGG